MFVIIVSRGFPQPGSPLRGIFEFDQAKALTDAGHKVVFLSVDLRSIRRKRKLGKANLHKDGVEIFNISVPAGRVPAWLFLRIGRMAFRSLYRDVIKIHGKPDVIHAHFTDIAAMTSMLNDVDKIPFVVTEHSSKLAGNTVDKKTGYFCRFAYAKANTVIAVSESLSIRLKQHFNVESMVIPNIVDINEFSYQPVDHDGFVFISVGNLIHRKGYDLLIDAFSKMQIKSSRLLIVGDGPEKPSLQKRIEALGLSDQILLMGSQNRREINKLMSTSNAFVLASRAETFGVVYIEAMAAGLPVIATRCGGPEEFVNQKCGSLVDIEDVKQLCNAMNDMHVNYHRYDRKWISVYTRRNFSPEVIARRLTSCYQEIVFTG